MDNPNLRDIMEVQEITSSDAQEVTNQYLAAGWVLLATGVMQKGEGTSDYPYRATMAYVVGRPQGVESHPKITPHDPWS